MSWCVRIRKNAIRVYTTIPISRCRALPATLRPTDLTAILINFGWFSNGNRGCLALNCSRWVLSVFGNFSNFVELSNWHIHIRSVFAHPYMKMWKFSEQKDRRTTLILGIFHCERAHSALRCLTYIPSVRHHVVYFCSGLSTTFHKINETASHFLFIHLCIPGARVP